MATTAQSTAALTYPILTTPPSMSSAKPFSKGSLIMVILLRLLGVSAKHLRDEVSTTVSQNDTTGSDTWEDNLVKAGSW